MTPSSRPETDIEVRSYFPTPVVVAGLPLSAAENEALAATILAREAAGAGVVHSNLLGWQSGDDFAEWGGEEGRKVLDISAAIADRLTGDRAGNRVSVPWSLNAWASINRKGQGNDSHAHPGSFLSGVYYVDDGGIGDDPSLGGELQLADPRGVAPAMYAPELAIALSGCATAGAQERILPRTGQAVIFPAWLMHGVRPYLGDKARISIAFNFWLPVEMPPVDRPKDGPRKDGASG